MVERSTDGDVHPMHLSERERQTLPRQFASRIDVDRFWSHVFGNRKPFLLPVNVAGANIEYLRHILCFSSHEKVERSKRVRGERIEGLRPGFRYECDRRKMKGNIDALQRV